MPAHEPRSLTPSIAANAQEPGGSIAFVDLGQWRLSVRNDVSRGIRQPARASRTVDGQVSAPERRSLRSEMFCP